MAKADVNIGDDVEWKWGTGKGQGKVTEVHTDHVTKTIKGSKVSRQASPDKPAVEVTTNKGAKVVKSVSEIKVK